VDIVKAASALRLNTASRAGQRFPNGTGERGVHERSSLSRSGGVGACTRAKHDDRFLSSTWKHQLEQEIMDLGIDRVSHRSEVESTNPYYADLPYKVAVRRRTSSNSHAGHPGDFIPVPIRQNSTQPVPKSGHIYAFNDFNLNILRRKLKL
jgi:hypothetical protein